MRTFFRRHSIFALIIVGLYVFSALWVLLGLS